MRHARRRAFGKILSLPDFVLNYYCDSKVSLVLGQRTFSNVTNDCGDERPISAPKGVVENRIVYVPNYIVDVP